MNKLLIFLVFLISVAIINGSEELDNFPSEEAIQLPEEQEEEGLTEIADEKSLVKRQAYRRPTGIFGLLSSFLRQPNYSYQQSYNQRPQINNYPQNQYYRPQQTFTQHPQFGGYQPNFYNQQRPQYYNYQQNQYQPFNFIDHLNKLPRNSETFGYYLDRKLIKMKKICKIILKICLEIFFNFSVSWEKTA